MVRYVLLVLFVGAWVWHDAIPSYRLYGKSHHLTTSTFINLYCANFVSEQREHLVYFVYAQRLLTLLQFAHEAQSHARLFR